MNKTINNKIFGVLFFILAIFSILAIWGTAIGIFNNPTFKDLNQISLKIFDFFSYIIPIYLLILSISLIASKKDNIATTVIALTIMPIITFSIFKQILFTGENQTLSNIENYKLLSSLTLILGVTQIVAIIGLVLFNKKIKIKTKKEKTYQPPSLFEEKEAKNIDLSFSPNTSNRPDFEQKSQELYSGEEVIEISLKNNSITENIKNSKNEIPLNNQDEITDEFYDDYKSLEDSLQDEEDIDNYEEEFPEDITENIEYSEFEEDNEYEYEPNLFEDEEEVQIFEEDEYSDYKMNETVDEIVDDSKYLEDEQEIKEATLNQSAQFELDPQLPKKVNIDTLEFEKKKLLKASKKTELHQKDTQNQA